ncbi:MAG: cyclopropane-fatty-acyl-phospholipid synthase [Candidatus Berkelbacteria bacterium Licking1014_7]|uniref:Cyclopropane-fatty-acyl-phospholipid synthase n=1 Tax=Candidatus Berkelbacteria bacterium Licking1014_7 TaxID=2017147 RepID=A0A554LIK9_9BACT|nr:MAG: cyclopropane-fatty-acyl-phospholipid synthase [Candidatus Berkelbacteria bacterium Licking1014_7]
MTKQTSNGVNRMKKTIQDIFILADVQINGNRPWDIQVHNQKLYARVLAGGILAFGESYMDGWWDCQAIDQLVDKILVAKLDENENTKHLLWKHLIWDTFKAKIINLQSGSRAYKVGKKHYDIGNDLYKNMLDKRIIYSCGYWDPSTGSPRLRSGQAGQEMTLDQAQEAKLDLICKKIGLKPGMRVLDIGCGWGGLAKYAAENYKVEVVGITISKEQVKLAKQLCKGLAIEIRLQDYRELKEKFDCIISVGMIEHVGYKNYRTYMEVVHRCLKPNGLFLLHTIGSNTSVISQNPWGNKYIFANSMLPSARQITQAAEGLFVMEDWHNFSADYDQTLMAWYNNFTKNWDKIKKNYDERFYRMWTLYLLACAGSFRARKNQLWQIVFSKNGVLGGYQSIR